MKKNKKGQRLIFDIETVLGDTYPETERTVASVFRFLVAFRPLKTLATSRNPLIKKQRRGAQKGQCLILELFRGGSAAD